MYISALLLIYLLPTVRCLDVNATVSILKILQNDEVLKLVAEDSVKINEIFKITVAQQYLAETYNSNGQNLIWSWLNLTSGSISPQSKLDIISFYQSPSQLKSLRDNYNKRFHFLHHRERSNRIGSKVGEPATNISKDGQLSCEEQRGFNGIWAITAVIILVYLSRGIIQ